MGADWVLSKGGGRVALYWSQNATEPHAIEEHYEQKWTRDMLDKTEEAAEERVPLPPAPPRKHQPAIITGRNGEEIKRQTRPWWAQLFDDTPMEIDCACPECIGEDLPWIARANATWKRWRAAAA